MAKQTTRVIASGDLLTLDQLDLTNADPLTVAIVDTSGNQTVALGGTQYAEDTPHVSGDTGTIALVVRNDAGTALAADGDRSVLTVNSSGALYVTGGGGGTEYTSDVASPTDPIGGTTLIVRDDTLSTQETADNDWTVMRGDSKGALWVRSSETTTTIIVGSLPTGTNAIGKLAANSGVDIGDVDVLSIAAGDNNIGNVDIVTVPSPLSTAGGGTEATALRVTVANDSTGVLSVDDNGSSLTVDGTVTATVTSSTMAGLQTDLRKIIGIVVDVNSGNKSAGTQRVVLASDQPNVPVNIATATTSVLSGLQVNVDQLNGIPISLNTGVRDTGTQRVSIATNDLVPVNLTTATTSVLAGIKVQIKNDSAASVTTTVVGIVTSASGDTKLVSAQGVGKQIYVYAWNLSFNGTVNAKFNDGTSSKLLAGLFYGVANAGGGNSVSPNFLLATPTPDLFHTSANSALYINLSGATAVGGSVSYFVK